MKTKYDAIFWDNDGVLINTEPLYYRSNKEILASYGIELTEAIFKEMNLIQGKSVLTLIPEANLPDGGHKAVQKRRDDLYEELISTGITALPGVTKVLQHIQDIDMPQAIVTSSRIRHFSKIHQQLNLKQYFSFSLTREDYQNSKPSPEPYLMAAEKMNLDPTRCLVIEDSFRGMTAAKDAGMSCFIAPGEFSKADFSRADHVLKDIVEIIDLV